MEVGWRLDRSFWGRGLATEGARASLQYGFKGLRVERVISIVRPKNVASRRVAENAGLTLRGETRFKGFDVMWYAIEGVMNCVAGAVACVHAEPKTVPHRRSRRGVGLRSSAGWSGACRGRASPSKFSLSSSEPPDQPGGPNPLCSIRLRYSARLWRQIGQAKIILVTGVVQTSPGPFGRTWVLSPSPRRTMSSAAGYSSRGIVSVRRASASNAPLAMRSTAGA